MKNNQPQSNVLPATSKFIIIPNSAVYDPDQEMWRTHIGYNKVNLPLAYTAWGKTADESMKLAQELAESQS